MPARPDQSGQPDGPGRSRLALAPDGMTLGPKALAFPGELALLVRMPLPLTTTRQRQSLVRFAVEDLIAAPLDAVHVALGPELGPGEYLVAVVQRDEMDAWAARTTEQGLRLVPDTLALPIPPEGAWSALELGGRVIVRCADGTGFCTRIETLGVFWRAAGSPQVLRFGGSLPDDMPSGATGIMPASPSKATAGFDLLQGPYAPQRRGVRRMASRLAIVACAGLLAHGGVLAVETAILQRLAAARETELRATIAEFAPGLPRDLPLDQAMRRALPVAGPASGFLPVLTDVAAALAPVGAQLEFRNLGFDAAGGSLSLLVEGPDIATLQSVEADLAAAGLDVTAGAASVSGDRAEVRFVIAGSGA